MQTIFAQVYAALFTLNIVITNPSNLNGPGHSARVCTILVKRIAQMEVGLEEPKLSIYNLLAERDFLDVRDAVAAYHLLLKKSIFTRNTMLPREFPNTKKSYNDSSTAINS